VVLMECAFFICMQAMMVALYESMGFKPTNEMRLAL
jgi:hypothetical protein